MEDRGKNEGMCKCKWVWENGKELLYHLSQQEVKKSHLTSKNKK